MSSYVSPEGTSSGVISIGSNWRGFRAIKNLVILCVALLGALLTPCRDPLLMGCNCICSGASYCDIGASPQSRPNKQTPLGVEFPGVTYAEPGCANWVGHLISPPISKGAERLVYGYAVGGARSDGVKGQILNRFLPNAGKKPDWASWSAEDTLFWSVPSFISQAKGHNDR